MRTVELRAARIPVVGIVALHHWLVVRDRECSERWEVWQRPDAGGVSWGHVHKDLLPAEAGVGWGPSAVVEVWRGPACEGLIERINASPETYPWRHRYRYWPGPNSNTYIQWLLGSDFELGVRALGKRFAHRLPGISFDEIKG